MILYHLARSLDRQTRLEDMVKRLWIRIEEQQILLNSALQELALSKPRPGVSTQMFINRWYAEHRGRP